MLTQEEADYLLNLQKECLVPQILLPPPGEKATFNVASYDRVEQFLLDVNRTGVIKFSRCTLQERYAVNEQLVRLDLDASKPHVNPDQRVIRGPHIHIYKAGFNDAWAYPLVEFTDYQFSDTSNILQTFIEFCEFCNIEITDGVQGTM